MHLSWLLLEIGDAGTEDVQRMGRSEWCSRWVFAPLLQLQGQRCVHFQDLSLRGLGADLGVGAAEEVFLFLLVLPRRDMGEGDSSLVRLGLVERPGEASMGYGIDMVIVGPKEIGSAGSTMINEGDVHEGAQCRAKTG